jgi:hypothetical protein
MKKENLDNFPTEIDILGIPYKLEYCDNPSNVDVHKRESLWGQIDFWTGTIRIYVGSGNEEAIWHTIWHEILHAIICSLKIKLDDDKEEDIVDLLSLGINNIMFKYFKFKKGSKNVKSKIKTQKKTKTKTKKNS